MIESGRLSAHELAEAVSTLIAVADNQQDISQNLLLDLKKSISALDQGVLSVTQTAPSKIAQQAARQILGGIGDQAAKSVANLHSETQIKTQKMIDEIEKATTAYQAVARDALQTCIVWSFLSSIAGTLLTALTVWFFVRFWP